VILADGAQRRDFLGAHLNGVRAARPEGTAIRQRGQVRRGTDRITVPGPQATAARRGEFTIDTP